MKTKTLFLVLVLALFLGAAGAALAQGDGVELPRRVLGGGASDSAAGNVILRATLGQPVVGVVASSGGEVALGQGFWHGGVAEYRIYLPLVLR
jgi:hypothetical protein